MVERSPSMRSPDFNTQEYNTTPHKFSHVREQISDIITALVCSRVLGPDHMTAKERLENSLSSRVVKTCFIWTYFFNTIANEIPQVTKKWISLLWMWNPVSKK